MGNELDPVAGYSRFMSASCGSCLLIALSYPGLEAGDLGRPDSAAVLHKVSWKQCKSHDKPRIIEYPWFS